MVSEGRIGKGRGASARRPILSLVMHTWISCTKSPTLPPPTHRPSDPPKVKKKIAHRTHRPSDPQKRKKNNRARAPVVVDELRQLHPAARLVVRRRQRVLRAPLHRVRLRLGVLAQGALDEIRVEERLLRRGVPGVVKVVVVAVGRVGVD